MQTFKTDRQILINLLKALNGKYITLIFNNNKFQIKDNKQILPILKID